MDGSFPLPIKRDVTRPSITGQVHVIVGTFHVTLVKPRSIKYDSRRPGNRGQRNCNESALFCETMRREVRSMRPI